MRIQIFLIAIIVGTAFKSFSQDWPVKHLTTQLKKSGKLFRQMPAFKMAVSHVQLEEGTYSRVQVNTSFIQRIMADRPETIQIEIPLDSSETILCDLVKASIGNIKFTENNDKIIPNVSIPVLYRGVIVGEQEKNTVVLTVNNDYLSLIASSGKRAIQITNANEAEPSSYRLYNSKKIQFPSAPLNCGSIASDESRQALNKTLLRGLDHSQQAVQDQCVNVFVECFDSLYQWMGSSKQRTLNYVYELFNLVTTGYLNDSINVQVIGINVWTTADPFGQSNRRQALRDLGAYYKDGFWGNICIGLDWGTTPRFGLAWLGKAKAMTPGNCPKFSATDSSGAFGYCDQNYGGSYTNFPTGPNVTQGQLYQVMHEMGHLLGSEHTQWCGWLLSSNPDVYGPIDNCAPVEPLPEKDSCSPGPAPPASGGTIMSYCNTAPAFVNYSNGFGPLPRKIIRSFISNNTCIPTCQACLIGRLTPGYNNKRLVEPQLLRASLQSVTGTSGALMR